MSPMEVFIRPVTPDLAATWEAMRRGLWPGSEEHGSEVAAFFKGSSTEPRAVFSAHDLSGAMIGFAELSIRFETAGLEQKPTGYVEGLYVIPARRKQAVARKLLRAARNWARDQGCVAFASDRADRVIIDSSGFDHVPRSSAHSIRIAHATPGGGVLTFKGSAQFRDEGT